MISVRAVASIAAALLTTSAVGLIEPSRAGAAPLSSTCTRLSSRPHVVYRAPRDGSGGDVILKDATSAWGLERPLEGMLVHAMAAADVNGDGWTDLFVGTFADRPATTYQVRGGDGPAPDRLLLGAPDGFHVDSSFPGRRGRTSGAAFVDLDGDGAPDLVIARNVRDIPNGRAPSEILRNVDGHFQPVFTFPAPRGARSIGLLDYDGDGRTDLFVTEDRWTGQRSSRLYHNDGDFHFTDVTEDVGLPAKLVGMGAGTADLNGDGTPDLFVGGSNRIFLNDGHGHFREGNSKVFRWKTFDNEDDPAGVAVGDVNRDGRTDILIGEHYGSTIDFGERVPVRLYINTGGDADGMPQFRDVTDAAGLVGLPTKSPHVEIADLDGDGWPDIVTSASVDLSTPVIFHNLGRGGGTPKFAVNGAPGPTQYWPTGVVVDVDHDGRPDVLLGEFDAARPSLGLRNRSAAGHWLGIGAPAGSVVSIYEAGTKPRALLGRTTVGASTGFGAGDPGVAWFGTGSATRVDAEVTRGHADSDLGTLSVDREVAISCADGSR